MNDAIGCKNELSEDLQVASGILHACDKSEYAEKVMRVARVLADYNVTDIDSLKSKLACEN